ncbi:MAG: phosphotransferase [Promethearchaeota archaeon]
MPWINLDTIDLIKFRKGYKTEDFHDLIIYSRDAKFMYPRVIEPLSCSFQNKEQLISFFNMYGYRFGLDEPVSGITRRSYMPGPGEIRPTHVVLRYDIQTINRVMRDVTIANTTTTNTKNHFSEQVVLKIVNSKYGYQEYRKQQKLFELGYPTPQTFYYCNYFTDIEDILKNNHENLPYKSWFQDFLRDIEIGKRLFSELKRPDNKARIQGVINDQLQGAGEGDKQLLLRFKEDLDNLDDGIFNGLEFKGFFFMDYLANALSFEIILFDILGGKHMEKASGAINVLPYRPFFNAENIINDVIDLIIELWELGECHNDFKGEHLLFDFKNHEWTVIDWGELVGGSRGKDLAVLLADSNAFVEDRCKFNIMFGRKKAGIHEELLKMEREILKRNSEFWDVFLNKLAERASSSVFKEAHRILQGRKLTFQASKLEPYF